MTDSEMSPVRAARLAMDLCKQDQDFRNAVAALCSRVGVADFAEYAEQNPVEAVMFYEAYIDVAEQSPPGMRPLR